MVERRGAVGRASGKLVAAVIYNRLHEGMPLGIDATTRFATGNYTEPLTESELAVDSPYNTRTNAGLPPGPIGSPGLASIEAAAHPAKADYLFYVVKPGTCGELAFSSTEAEFEADVARYNEAREAAGGNVAGQLRGMGDAAARRARPPGRPLALAGDAQRGAGRARPRRRSGATRRSTSPPTTSRRGSASDAGRGVRRRQRHRPAQGRGAGASPTSPRETAREIGAANTLSFADGEIRADNTDAPGLLAALPAPPAGRAGPGARRRRRRPRRGLGAGPRGRRGRGLEPDRARAPANLCAELGGRPVAAPDQADYELIVNTTAVGLRGEDPFAELPLARRRLRRRPDRRRHGLRRAGRPRC